MQTTTPVTRQLTEEEYNKIHELSNRLLTTIRKECNPPEAMTLLALLAAKLFMLGSPPEDFVDNLALLEVNIRNFLRMKTDS